MYNTKRKNMAVSVDDSFFGYNTSPNSVVHFEFVIFFINDFRDSLISFQGNNAKTPREQFFRRKF